MNLLADLIVILLYCSFAVGIGWLVVRLKRFLVGYTEHVPCPSCKRIYRFGGIRQTTSGLGMEEYIPPSPPMPNLDCMKCGGAGYTEKAHYGILNRPKGGA